MAEGTDSDLNELIQMQHDYMARHDIHPGWLIDRTTRNDAQNPRGVFLSGDIAKQPAMSTICYYALDTLFLQSCLSGVMIHSLPDPVPERLAGDAGLIRLFRKMGIRPSGTLRCKPERPYLESTTPQLEGLNSHTIKSAG